MTKPDHQLSRRSTSGDYPGRPGMPEIMQMDLRTTDLLSSGTPRGLKYVRSKRSTLFSPPSIQAMSRAV